MSLPVPSLSAWRSVQTNAPWWCHRMLDYLGILSEVPEKKSRLWQDPLLRSHWRNLSMQKMLQLLKGVRFFASGLIHIVNWYQPFNWASTTFKWISANRCPGRFAGTVRDVRLAALKRLAGEQSSLNWPKCCQTVEGIQREFNTGDKKAHRFADLVVLAGFSCLLLKAAKNAWLRGKCSTWSLPGIWRCLAGAQADDWFIWSIKSLLPMACETI